MSARREDRFPLLFVVNVAGDSLEKPPLDHPTPSVRDRNVTRGAATLISRWPQHVQSTSRLAFLTAFTIMCMSFFVVAVIFYTSDITFSDGFGFRGRPRRRLAVCGVDKNHVYDGADVNALVELMTPLPRAWEFFEDEEKIFFVMSQGDTLTADKRCAVETAIRANANSTVYLLLLVDTPVTAPRTEEAFNGTVSVLYVDAERYLKDTPLGGLRGRGATRVLAARMVTLWRFGGVSLDVDVLSLARLPRRKAKNAYVDMDGSVMIVRHPCHAFMFQAMKVLDRMRGNDTVADDEMNAGAVLTVAQDLYCRKPHCRNRSSNGGKCPGFKVLPKGSVCSVQHRPNNSACIWASFTPQDVSNKYFNDICEISSNSQQNPCI